MASDDNIYVGGEYTNDMWIAKYSSAGVEDGAWNKTLDVGGHSDRIYAMAVDSKDNLYVAGFSDNGSDADWCIKNFRLRRHGDHQRLGQADRRRGGERVRQLPRGRRAGRPLRLRLCL